jgi:predicted RNase H-like nuclease (RuvC/YqgF family)
MATKEDIGVLRTELKDDIAKLDGRVVAVDQRIAAIEHEVSGIRRDLDELAAKAENSIGYRKEIDHAFERIAAIEKHLGIRRPPAG